VVDHLSEQYANAILTSHPAHTAVREEHYHLHHALHDVVAQLGVYVSEAHELMSDPERQGQQEDEE
jgi:hypothetical protein